MRVEGLLFSQVSLTTTRNMCNSSHGDGFQSALSAGEMMADWEEHQTTSLAAVQQ